MSRSGQLVYRSISIVCVTSQNITLTSSDGASQHIAGHRNNPYPTGRLGTLCEERSGEDDTDDGGERRRAKAGRSTGQDRPAGRAGGTGATSARSRGGSAAGTLGGGTSRTGGARGTRRAGGRAGRGAGRAGGRGELREELRRLEGDTVRRGGDARGVGHRGDGAERLGGLGVGHDLAVGSVYTGEVLVVGVAHLEDTLLRGVRADVAHTDTVEDVLAVVGRVRVRGVAHLEARGVRTNEARQV